MLRHYRNIHYRTMTILSLFLSRPTLSLFSLTMICDVCGEGALPQSVPRIIFQSRKRSALRNCSAGQFFNNSLNLCDTCPQGTFMTESMARGAWLNDRCQGCDIADDTAIVRHPCNATSNAVIGCMEKYYKVRVEDSIYQCKACSTCGLGVDLFRDFEVRPCTEEVDALCCYEAHDVLWKGQCTHRDDVPVTTTSTHVNRETQSTVGKNVSSRHERLIKSSNPHINGSVAANDSILLHCKFVLTISYIIMKINFYLLVD